MIKSSYYVHFSEQKFLLIEILTTHTVSSDISEEEEDS